MTPSSVSRVDSVLDLSLKLAQIPKLISVSLVGEGDVSIFLEHVKKVQDELLRAKGNSKLFLEIRDVSQEQGTCAAQEGMTGTKPGTDDMRRLCIAHSVPLNTNIWRPSLEDVADLYKCSCVSQNASRTKTLVILNIFRQLTFRHTPE